MCLYIIGGDLTIKDAEMDEKRTKYNECYSCKHKRTIPGDAHLKCVNPDPKMTGNKYGIAGGWFMYPLNFDPTWKAKDCSNYETK